MYAKQGNIIDEQVFTAGLGRESHHLCTPRDDLKRGPLQKPARKAGRSFPSKENSQLAFFVTIFFWKPAVVGLGRSPGLQM